MDRPTPKRQIRQQDPDTLQRLGGWLFRYRTSIPLPIALALLLIPAGSPPSSLSTSAAWVGVPVVVAGELVRLWAVHHIGTISRTRTERLGPLIDTGPFAFVRNPLYVGNILLWLGFALSARLLWLAAVVVVLLAFEYHAIVRWEETLLVTRLGDAYRRYMMRVPRWIPTVGRAVTEENDRSDHDAPHVFSWRETFCSERGTLIAIAVGYALLAVKTRWLQALGFRL